MARYTILLTNDDGCNAPGLVAAYEALSGLGDVHVVAPKRERSGCSHSITLGRPITVERVEMKPFGRVYSVDGSPADCVRLGFAELVEGKIDLVLSGINRGANAGIDVYYSGTIGAAREGAFLGIPAIAMSQAVRSGVEVDWSKTGEVAGDIIRQLLGQALPGPGFWSANLPAPIPSDWKQRIFHVPTATRPVPMQFDRLPNGDDDSMEFNYGASYWARDEEGVSDYNVIRDGGISITAIPLHATFA